MEDQNKSNDEQFLDDMEVVTENGEWVVTISNGQKVTVNKCKLRHFSTVVQLLKEFMASMGVTDIDKAEEQVSDLNDIGTVMDFISNSTNSVFVALELLTSLDGEEVQELDLDDALVLATLVWERNKDFFLNKVLPMVKGGL